jgi:hypothetical protein
MSRTSALRWPAAVLVVAASLGPARANAQTSGRLDFRAKHEVTVTADLLRSDIPMLEPRDAQLSVWVASDLRLRCTRPACKNATVVARPWIGTFLGPERASRSPRFRDIHDKATMRAQEWYGSVSPLPWLAVKAGSVVAGWGTGLLYSPTNRLAAETMFSSQQRQVRGQRMASIAVQGTDTVAVTVIAARADQNRWHAADDRQFRLLVTRADYQGTGRRALNLGAVTGGGRRHATFAGAYGQMLINDAVTAGFEISASRGYARDRDLLESGDGKPRPYRADVSLNVRYGLPTGGEIGLEAVFNGFGVASDQATPAIVAAQVGALLAGDRPIHPLAERRYFTVLARLPKLLRGQRVTATSSLTVTGGPSGAVWFGELSYARNACRLFGASSIAFGAAQSTVRVPFHQTSRVGIQISR